METIIKRKLEIQEIEELFESYSQAVNIRFYEPEKVLYGNVPKDLKLVFKIRIRHGQDENPAELYKVALKELRKKNNRAKVLLKRLENYDTKYEEAISKPSNINWGYGMRAYHALKVQNPPEWKIAEKAEKVAEELRNLGVRFHTTFLKLSYN